MTDRRTVFAVTLFLGLIVLGGLGAVVALTLFDKAIPELVSNTTTGALGALSALLVSTRVDPAQLPAADPSVAGPTTANERWIVARLTTDAGSQPAKP